MSRPSKALAFMLDTPCAEWSTAQKIKAGLIYAVPFGIIAGIALRYLP